MPNILSSLNESLFDTEDGCLSHRVPHYHALEEKCIPYHYLFFDFHSVPSLISSIFTCSNLMTLSVSGSSR